MKARDIGQSNKQGPNIVGDKVQIDQLISIGGDRPKRDERIPRKDNSDLHNLSLWLYGFLFKKMGFFKAAILFGISGTGSALYLIQTFFLEWFKNSYLTAASVVLMFYSLYFFQFFKNRSCADCGSKFSLAKKGTYKIEECTIKGVPHDINEEEFECIDCGKSFIEKVYEPHEGYDAVD